jgi:hypothetical protein
MNFQTSFIHPHRRGPREWQCKVVVTMASETAAEKSVDKAFLAALLLTGSPRRAEASVLESIRLLANCEEHGDALLQGAVAAALDALHESPDTPADEIRRAASMLPIELRRVLDLAPDLRQSYVLRLLVGLPGESCERLLRLERGQADQAACRAALALAGEAEREKAA